MNLNHIWIHNPNSLLFKPACIIYDWGNHNSDQHRIKSVTKPTKWNKTAKKYKSISKGLIKRKNVDPTNLFLLEATLRKQVGEILCNLDNTGDYHHFYLVINDAKTNWRWPSNNWRWPSNTPIISWVIQHKGCYRNRKMRKWISWLPITYKRPKSDNQVHPKHIQKSSVLIDLKDEDGHIDDDPVNIIKHLWTLVPKPEKGPEIHKLEKILHNVYNPN